MKKIAVSVLLVLCMLIMSAPMFCLASEAPKLTVSTEKAAVGTEVCLSVSAENNPGVMAMILGVDYDADALEFIGPEDAGFKGWKYSERLVWLGSGDDTYNGAIVKLKFKVLDSAENGSTEVGVSVRDGDICNYDEEIIDFAVVSGGVEIEGGQEAPPDTQPSETKEDLPASETPEQVDGADNKTNESIIQKADSITDKGATSVPEPVNNENNADTAEDGKQAQSISETGETVNGDNTLWIIIASIAVIAVAVIMIKRKRNGY